MCDWACFAFGGFGFVWVWFEVFVGFAAVFFGVWRSARDLYWILRVQSYRIFMMIEAFTDWEALR
jgi:hypothetical protein